MGYWNRGDELNNGKFVVEELLGSGGFGVTYKVKHIRTNKLYALKTLNELAKSNPNFPQLQVKFINEAIALASCRHPNIVRVYPQGFQEGELWCMVMEYVEGEDLACYLDRNGRFEEQKAVEIITKLGKALSFVHQQDLLHRDIKPANILLRNSDLSPVLIDFGLAREYTSGTIRSMTNSMTECYAPIEQYQTQGNFGAWTDVYALAATLYVLVTKEIPFPARFRAHAQLPPPKQHNPDLSDRLNQAILKGMAIEPGDRPQSVEEWLKLLKPSKEKNNNKSISVHNQKWFGFRIVGEPDADYNYFFGSWDGLIFWTDYGELFSFPTKSHNKFEIHVLYRLDCSALNEKIAIAIRDKKYEQSSILSVIGQNYELVLFDDLLSLSEACKSEIKMVIWFDEKLSFEDRLAGLNQLTIDYWSRYRPHHATLRQVFFDTVKVNDKGETIETEHHVAEYFTEDLGNGITLDMIEIRPGSFLIGTEEREIERLVKKYDRDWFTNESPQHQVNVDDFYMAKFLVTQAQWKRVAALPQIEKELKPNPSYFKGDDLPVEKISWYDAIEFCKRLSKATGKEYRLPSEAEWEYACRAGTNTPFYFGETITTDLANYNGNYTYANEPQGEYRKKTTPVGSFPPNAFGLYDMHGNIWEWCLDTWHGDYQGAPSDGSPWISEASKYFVVRGGSYNLKPENCRSTLRYRDYPDNFFNLIGFRCVVARTL